MKMTPEQKAFYEYGKAVANLSVAKEFLLLSPCSLKKYADNVARKEAACRAWVPAEERYCSNCRHIKEIADVGTICEKCPHNNGSYYDVNKWEPRKEGE